MIHILFVVFFVMWLSVAYDNGKNQKRIQKSFERYWELQDKIDGLRTNFDKQRLETIALQEDNKNKLHKMYKEFYVTDYFSKKDILRSEATSFEKVIGTKLESVKDSFGFKMVNDIKKFYTTAENYAIHKSEIKHLEREAK